MANQQTSGNMNIPLFNFGSMNKKTKGSVTLQQPFGSQPFGSVIPQQPLAPTTSTPAPIIQFGSQQQPFGSQPFGSVIPQQTLAPTTPQQPFGSVFPKQPLVPPTSQQPFVSVTPQPTPTSTPTPTPTPAPIIQFGSQQLPLAPTTSQPFVSVTPQPTPTSTSTPIIQFGSQQLPLAPTTSQPFGSVIPQQPTPAPIIQFGTQAQQLPTNTQQPFGSQLFQSFFSKPIEPISQPQIQPQIQKSDLYNFLYTERYNPDCISQTNDNILIDLGNSIVLSFEIADKLRDDTYKLRDKRNDIEIAIRFSNRKCLLSNEELNLLKIRPVGKPLFNKTRNRLESCYFTEKYDGTLSKYISLKGELDTASKLRIVEQVRKFMVSLYERNNLYVYTDITLENVIYNTRGDEVDFGLIVGNMPYDSRDNIYLSTYPSIEIQAGEFPLKTNEDKLHAMSWQIGILLLSLIGNNTVQFNKLNWLCNKAFKQDDYSILVSMMKNSYGDKIATYIHNIPNQRPSMYEPLI